MKISIELIRQTVVRFLSVAGLIIAIAYLIYHNSIFISTIIQFQYFISGITIGIAYAAFSANYFREGIASLFLWFIFLTGALHEYHTWRLYTLTSTYIGIIACGVYLCLFINRKSYFTNRIMNIVTSGVIIGILNSLIIVFLRLFTPMAYLSMLLKVMHLNLRIGVVMGLLFGIGVELSNYIIKSFPIQKEVAS